MTLPQYSATGTWTLTYVWFEDAVGNTRLLYPTGLSAAGFPTTFTNG
jgi:hypothetical protein